MKKETNDEAAREAAESVKMEQLLNDYNLQHTADDDGNALGLADALTPPQEDSITLGKQEIALLADYILANWPTSEKADNDGWVAVEEFLMPSECVNRYYLVTIEYEDDGQIERETAYSNYHYADGWEIEDKDAGRYRVVAVMEKPAPYIQGETQ